MASGPDLFVVCKNCGAEVSPYITECPYCGNRLRKRAPKIERDGTISEPKVRRSRRAKTRREPRERRIPGVSAPAFGSRPWATIVLVGLSMFMWLALVWIADFDVIPFAVADDPQKLLYGVFAYFNAWYQLAVLVAIGVFGWLLERRHGPVLVVALFLLCGPGALAIAVALDVNTFVFGSHGAALGMLCAWLVPVLIGRSRGEGDDDADLLGVLVIAVVLLLVPVLSQGSAVAGVVGAGLGALAGLALAGLRPAR